MVKGPAAAPGHQGREQTTSIHTFLPYFPAARQDRAPDRRAPFTLRYTSLLLSPERQRGVCVFLTISEHRSPGFQL